MLASSTPVWFSLLFPVDIRYFKWILISEKLLGKNRYMGTGFANQMFLSRVQSLLTPPTFLKLENSAHGKFKVLDEDLYQQL